MGGGQAVTPQTDRLNTALAGRYTIERFVQEITTTASLQHPLIPEA